MLKPDNFVFVFSVSLRGGWCMKRRKRQKEKRKMMRRIRALMKAFCYRHTMPWRGWRSLCTRSEAQVHLSRTHLFHSSVNRCALSLSLYVEGRTVRLNAWHQHTWPELSAHSCIYTNTPQSTNTEDIPAKPDAHLLAPAASHLNLV